MHASAYLAAAEGALLRAGAYVREQFHAPPQSRPKSSDHDRVTDADGTAEDMIRGDLLRAHPRSVVVGEERGAVGSGRLSWYVDPIDGTYNFARGIPLFCLSVGMAVDGVVVGGCVYDPVRDEMFSASEGVLRVNGMPAPRRRQGPAMLLTDLPVCQPHAMCELAPLAEALADCDVRRIGSSALALAWVAAGRADLAANTNVYAWDVAAGRALVTASGGGYTGLPDQELRTDRQGGFVAWGPAHAAEGLRLAEVLRPTVAPGHAPARPVAPSSR
jgi:myo-inositol-1(or 4)-monophosphatase